MRFLSAGLHIALGLSVSMQLVACSGATCPVQTFPNVDGLQSHHTQQRAWARNMRAEARVDRRDGDGRVRGTVLMLVERPDRVRFDAMTQFGPAAVLTSDGTSFALTDLRENRFFAGPTCAENIALLLGIPLEAQAIGGVLFGEAPMIEGAAVSADSPRGEAPLTCESGQYVVRLRGADGSLEELRYDVLETSAGGDVSGQRTRLREGLLHDAAGELVWRIRWDDYAFVEDPTDTQTPRRGIAMAHRIQLELPAQHVDTLVRFERIELNASMPADAFTQTVRPGLSVEPVECGH